MKQADAAVERDVALGRKSYAKTKTKNNGCVGNNESIEKKADVAIATASSWTSAWVQCGRSNQTEETRARLARPWLRTNAG